METKFNFKSSVCTSREQSERLLALGLKKETADCYWFYCDIAKEWKCTILSSTQIFKDYPTTVIPAWSLGRLIEMLPSTIPVSEDLPTFHQYAFLNLSNESVGYYWEDYDGAGRILVGFSGNGFFSAVVDATEWLIKEKHFNSEYIKKLIDKLKEEGFYADAKCAEEYLKVFNGELVELVIKKKEQD